MKTLPDNSVDAIVTDPPYGLNDGSDGLNDVFFSSLFDVFFPEFNKRVSKSLNLCELSLPSDRVMLLNSMNRAFWVEPNITVPEGSVDFDYDFVDWNEEIKDADKSTVTSPDGALGDILNSHRIENGNNFFLKLRRCVNSPLRDSSTTGFTEFGFGRLGVSIVIPLNSCFASFLRSLSPCSTSSLGDIIGLLNDPLALSESPSLVMTSSGAELRAVLTFDLTNGSSELRPATRTSKFDAVFEVICPENVGTILGTGSLSSMFKPSSVSLVDGGADGAFSINLHKFMMPYINKKSSGFMGKKWDYDVPKVEVWQEAMRVLKPGGHALIACGTRTQHRMVVNIEDAGFEIRDCIFWHYGQGFPKSLNISKAIDKAAGAEREVTGSRVADNIKGGNMHASNRGERHVIELKDAPATEAAKQWDGWGTALKPSTEIFTLARKPLSEKTVAANVLKWGTGGINIDGCRVGLPEGQTKDKGNPNRVGTKDDSNTPFGRSGARPYDPTQGRFPANLIHDGSQEVLDLFPSPHGAGAKRQGQRDTSADATGMFGMHGKGADRYGDQGSAARFFYCPKASKKDRDEGNNHPTVKPTALMAYLCRLITPPGGTVLDPYMGSGSTGKAALSEGFGFIGCELDGDYFKIAQERIKQ